MQTLNRDRTFCRICEAACGLQVLRDRSGRATSLRPDRSHPHSHGFACAKGTGFLARSRSADRLLTPQRLVNGQAQALSWRAALRDAGQTLRALRQKHGAHSVAVYMGNPMVFGALAPLAVQMLVRSLGTRNLFTAGSQDCNNKFAASQYIYGSALVHPLADLDNADVALMLGTDPAVSQLSFRHYPDALRRILAIEKRGGTVWWVDPRPSASVRAGGQHVAIVPGADVWLLLWLIRQLSHTPRWLFWQKHHPQITDFCQYAKVFATNYLAEQTGLAPERLEALAQSLAEAKTVTSHMGVGVNMGRHGTLAYLALHVLMAGLGMADREGGWLYHPDIKRVADLARRAGVASTRHSSRIGHFAPTLDSLPAAVMADEILEAGDGQVRGLIVIGGDPAGSVPGLRLSAALDKLEYLVQIDLFRNHTSDYADLLLPATSWLERPDLAATALLFQTQGSIPWSPAVQKAPGQTRPDWKILLDLTARIAGGGMPSWLRHLPLDELMEASMAGLADGNKDLRSDLLAAGASEARRMPERFAQHGQLRFSGAWVEDLFARLRLSEARVLPAKKGWHQVQLLVRRQRLRHNNWIGEGTPEVEMGSRLAARLSLRSGARIEIREPNGSALVATVEINKDFGDNMIAMAHGGSVSINRLLSAEIEDVDPSSGQLHMTGRELLIRKA